MLGRLLSVGNGHLVRNIGRSWKGWKLTLANIQRITKPETTILGMEMRLNPIVPGDEIWITTKDEVMKYIVLAEEPPAHYVLERITSYVENV